MNSLNLHGIGHFHPANVIDNDFLEKLDIGVSQEWIMERVGIVERRTVLSTDYIAQTKNKDPRAATEASEFSNAQTGARAALLAISRAGLQPADIGLVIAGGCSPQYTIPSEACMIAAELGIDVRAFDLHSACSSFALQLHFLSCMRPETLPDFVLIVNPENTTRTVDYSDRKTAVLWGDGTVAAVVSLRIPLRTRIKFSTYESDPSGWSKVTIERNGHFRQEGAAVQSFAIKKTLDILDQLSRHSSSDPRRRFFIGHQGNLRMLQSICHRRGIDPGQHLFNVDHFGNCSAAGAPSVLSQHWECFSSEEEVAMTVVGSGLAWGGLLFGFDKGA